MAADWGHWVNAPPRLRPLDLIPIVPGSDFQALIPGILPWLEIGCAEEAEWDVPGIMQGYLDGRFLIWAAWQQHPPAVKGVWVMRLSTNHRGEKIAWDVVFAGEELHRMMPLLDRIEDALRQQGVHAIRILGRPGWMKRLPHYKRRAILLEKRLT